MKKHHTTHRLFSPRARWIWDAGGGFDYHRYVRMRRTFTVKADARASSLLITADANYQAWLNGCCVGHGPAKSAEGARSVDRHDLTPFLQPGENTLEVLVLSIGTGNMTYCLGRAGLIFEIDVDGVKIASDRRTRVRRETERARPTVRRWMMPCIEDVDTAARPGPWRAATEIEKKVKLYPRRVALPTREEVYPKRLAWRDRVDFPNFSVSYRIKPALVDKAEMTKAEHYFTEATFRVPIISPRAQTLRLTPTLGNVEWSFNGKKIVQGGAWGLWEADKVRTEIRLKAGRNELVGRHILPGHFEDLSLAGFAGHDVKVGALQVERKDGVNKTVEAMPFANGHDLATGAKVAEDGTVQRTIWDLGCVLNGWLAFDVKGRAGQRLLITFFEGMESGAHPRFQWPNGCNNAVTYRLRDGWQRFESFFPYGVRYVAVHEVGGPVELSGLRILKATCSGPAQGTFLTDDPQLNGVYRICAQCIESATDDTYTDCPTFEQVNWNFDNRMAALGDRLIAANSDIDRNSMLLFAEDPQRTGLVMSQTPSAWRRPIPMWSFHWILWSHDYYRHTGDRDFLRRILPTVREGVREARGMIGANGLMSWGSDTWHFIEWAPGRDDDHAICTAEQATLLRVMEATDELSAALGQKREFAAARAQLRQAIRRHLWDAKRRCFIDSLHADGTRSKVASQVTNAIAALCGAGDEKWSRELAATLAAGKSTLLPLGSPPGLYYILELWDRHGFRDAIFKTIRHRWGAMLDVGDGTTWETFAECSYAGWPSRSRCHPYAAFVVKYLVKYVLGVEALEPGFARVRVKPQPPETLNAGAGVVPTPHGPLRVSWTRAAKGGTLALDIAAPPGVKVVRG